VLAVRYLRRHQQLNLHAFRKKIYCPHPHLRMPNASHKGGKCVKNLLTHWEKGPKYGFKVFYDEVDVLQQKNENGQLIGQKECWKIHWCRKQRSEC